MFCEANLDLSGLFWLTGGVRIAKIQSLCLYKSLENEYIFKAIEETEWDAC